MRPLQHGIFSPRSAIFAQCIIIVMFMINGYLLPTKNPLSTGETRIFGVNLDIVQFKNISSLKGS